MSMRGLHEDGDFNPTYVHDFVTPEQFAEAKIDMLRNHFRIDLSEEDIAHFRELKTESAINAAVMAIFNKYWEV